MELILYFQQENNRNFLANDVQNRACRYYLGLAKQFTDYRLSLTRITRRWCRVQNDEYGRSQITLEKHLMIYFKKKTCTSL